MAIEATTVQLDSLSSTLLNVSGKTPLHERFRALFTLKAIGGPQAVQIIAKGFEDHSALLKHELAYCLGQIGDMTAVPVLEGVLKDEKDFQGEMVRHEAAEALGALSSLSSVPLLQKYLTDPSRSVRETCEIAIAKIEWDNSEEGKARGQDPNFPTIDPAPSSRASSSAEAAASSSPDNETIPTLRTQLLDTKLPLFERYRAMFALRNAVVQATGQIGRSEPGAEGAAGRARMGVEVLAEGFADESALFRHEIAYIFGQLSSPFSIPSLLRVMRDPVEDDMVRHEAAEALGGIASDSDAETSGGALDLFSGDEEDRRKGVLGILKEWCTKESAPSVVRESCQVAVDMWEYENSDQFQYASGLSKGEEDAGAEGEKQAPAQRMTGMDRGVAVLV